MRKFLLICINLLLAGFVFAQATPSTIKSVTVYRQNASITRDAQIQLKAGKQEIVLVDLSTSAIPASLQVQMSASGVTLLSAKYLLNYIKEKKESPEVTKLQKEIEILDDEISWVNEQKAILKNLETVLAKNQSLGGTETGFTSGQLIELINSTKAKALEIKKENRQLNQTLKELNKKRSKIKKQLGEIYASNNNKATGSIVLAIQSNRATSTKLSCTYLVKGVSWSPQYDLRSEGIKNDVQLFYKANIRQSTGYDWNNVKMTVSTGNPTLNNNRPILSPLYANIFAGYASQPVAAPKKYSMNMMLEKENADDKSMQSGYSYNAAVNTNQLSIEFELSGRHEVKSDGKDNLLALKTYQLTTDYVYHTVPKLDKGAFLLAKISDWGQYNLESGPANIFFEGAYIGATHINAQVTSEELLVSMGRDQSIVVTRTPVKEFKEKKLLGTKRKETIGYDIVVKNKKSTAIKIEILDQIPVSQNEKITVDLKDKDGAKYNEEIGKLLWSLDISPGQTIKKRFVYTIKYPEKVQVSGVR